MLGLLLGVSIALNVILAATIIDLQQHGISETYSRNRPESSGNISPFLAGNRSGDFATLQAPAVMTTVSYSRQGRFIFQQTDTNGTMMDISVEIIPGQGRVLVQTTPLMGVVFQDAANTAVLVAASQTSTDLSGQDVVVSIHAPGEIPEVDGPSAGALMSAVTVAALEHRGLNQSVTLTGTIDPAGHIGQIGGVVEKAQAARQFGKTLFLLPQENSNLLLYSTNQQTRSGRIITFQTPESVDAKQFIEENIGIQVEYVDNISDITKKLLI